MIDTDVLVAAFDSPSGASRQLVLSVLDGRVELLLSTALLIEYEAVLTRPHILKMIAVTADEVIEVLDELAAGAVRVPLHFRWRPAARDPDDEIVIETAVNGEADVIATFNIRDMKEAAAQFGIAVKRPAQALRRIGT